MMDFTDYIYDAQQGSQSAVKFIYDNTLPLFYKEACAFFPNRSEAEAAVRDAYIFIFDHLSSLEDTSKFLLWANEVCKNTCIARMKQAGVFTGNVPAEASHIGEILPSSEFDAQINLQANMDPDHIQMCLEAVLDSLPEEQRACAILWGEGYPIGSIARKLGMSHTYVNYTLAYALGNITNSITTLGENGLPLYSMDPIPYFLWLLISYYQYYQPEVLSPGSECSFENILRILMPEEASIFMSEYDRETTEYTDADGKVQQVTEIAAEAEYIGPAAGTGAAGTSAGENGSGDASPEKDGSAGTGTKAGTSADASGDSEEASDIPVPPMDIYPAHPEEAGVNLEDYLHGDSVAERGAEEAAQAAAFGTSVFDDVQDSLFGGKKETADGSSADASGVGVVLDGALNSDAGDSAAGDTAGDTGAAENSSGVSEGPADSPFTAVGSDGPQPAKKRHTGLIVLLIIVLVILCLALAFIFFGSVDMKNKINDLLGTKLFDTTQTTQTAAPPESEPEGDDANAAAQADDANAADQADDANAATQADDANAADQADDANAATQADEPATEEPAAQADPGPTYKAVIYAFDDYTGEPVSLAMKAEANGYSDRLQYIPADTEVTIEETQDGWGRTTYDGMEGWIWLEFTKVVGNARVTEPDEFLEEPQTITVEGTGNTLELRTGPGTSYSTFGVVPDGTQLTIEAYSMDLIYGGVWAYTSYDGHHGWVNANYLISY